MGAWKWGYPPHAGGCPKIRFGSTVGGWYCDGDRPPVSPGMENRGLSGAGFKVYTPEMTMEERDGTTQTNKKKENKLWGEIFLT